ncbi:MAG: EAL domain-containing protein [Gammaproteobacteria bacterium]|nr:EAL domain-containing protein [Gammaproteobacteria bacterium]
MTKNVNPERLAQLQCLARAIEQTEDSVLITDRDGVIQFVNRGFERITGYARTEAVGQTPALLKSGAHDGGFYHRLWQTILSGQVFRELFTNRRKDNALYREAKTITPVKDEAGQITHFISTGKDISERLRIEQQLRDSEERFRQLTDHIHEVFWLTDPNKNQMLYISPAYEAIWGRRCESLYADPRSWLDAIHPEDRERVLHAALTDQASGRYTVEYRILRPDGAERWILDRAFPVRNTGGDVYRIAGIAEDITERKHAAQTLQDSEARLRAIIDAEPACVKLMQADGTLLQINAAGLAMIEADSAEAVVGQRVCGLVTPEYREQVQNFIKRVAHGEPDNMEFEIIGLKGGHRWLDTHAVPFSSPATNGARLLVAVTRDISEQKRAERELLELVHHDSLTGLPNRLLFTDRLRQAMVEAGRHERLVGVALLDLDQFKKINDSLGYVIGDALLKQVGERLSAALRPGDTIARLGGDEFTLVLADMAHVDDATMVLQKIRSAFEAPFRVDGHELFTTASIGVTLFPFDDKDAQALLRNADIAMYRAKEKGRNTWQFYAAEMTAKATENLAIESALHTAIERHEFELHYQPQVNLATGRITGVEALLRWRHPELGNVPPDRFIPVAEDNSLIVPIGEWVLRTACTQASRWHAARFAPLQVAVNVSSHQLRDPGFPDTVQRILDETGFPATMLELELTERTLLENAETIVVALDRLKVMGVRFAVDDFGTGYSSLGYLRLFPINVLKIDKSFTAAIENDTGTAAIVRAIITMAHELGMPVVAEGAETAAQCTFLRQHKCDTLQGYHFSRPVPAQDVTRMLTDGKTL